MSEREHRNLPPPPPTVLNKLQTAHPYDTGSFSGPVHTRWNCALTSAFCRLDPSSPLISSNLTSPAFTHAFSPSPIPRLGSSLQPFSCWISAAWSSLVSESFLSFSFFTLLPQNVCSLWEFYYPANCPVFTNLPDLTPREGREPCASRRTKTAKPLQTPGSPL